MLCRCSRNTPARHDPHSQLEPAEASRLSSSHLYNPGMPSRTVPRPATTAWLLAALGILAGSVWLAGHPRAYTTVLPVSYLPSLAAALAGCLIADRTTRDGAAHRESATRWSRRTTLLAAALVVAAGLARVWGFPDWPPMHGLGFEEEELGGAAVNLLELSSHPIEHRLPTYAAALGFALFGPSIFSLRLVFVAMSALAPWLFFGACRRLARPQVALLCTAMYGFSWWATAAGRFADEIFFVAPLTAAVVRLLVVTLDERRTLPALALGVLSGALIFEYTAYRLVPVLLAGYLLIRLVRKAWREVRGAPEARLRALTAGFRPLVPRGAALLLGASVSVLPAAIPFASASDASLLEAFRRHTAVPVATIHKRAGELAALVLKRSGRLAGALAVPGHGEEIPWMNVASRRPNLGPIAAAVLATGCLLALLRLRTRLHGLLAVWITVSAGTALAVPLNENTMRYFTVFPVAWLLAASGLEQVWPGPSRPRAGRAAAAVAVTLAVAVAASDTYFLHHVLAPDAAVRANFASRCITTARVIGGHPPGSLTVLASDVCGNLAEHPDIKWLLAGRRVVVAESLAEAVPPVASSTGPVLLVSATTVPQPGLAALLATALPGSSLAPADPWPHGDLDLVALRLPAAAQPLRRLRWGPGNGGFLVQSFEGPPGEPSDPGRPPGGSVLYESHGEPFLTTLGQRNAALEHAYALRGSADTVYWVAWSGTATPPPGCQGVRLRLRSGYAWLWLDGTLVLKAGYRGPEVVAEERAMDLPPGRAVTVEACSYHIGNDPPALQVEWLGPDGGALLSGAGRPTPVYWLDELAAGPRGTLPAGRLLDPATRVEGRMVRHGLALPTARALAVPVPPEMRELTLSAVVSCPDGGAPAPRELRIGSGNELVHTVRLEAPGEVRRVALAVSGSMTLVFEVGGPADGCEVLLLEPELVAPQAPPV